MPMRPNTACLVALALWVAVSAEAAPFRFAILGDRTGEAQPGVFQQVWNEAVAEHPAFLISTGDSIEGLDDHKAEVEWREFDAIWAKHRTPPLYLVPGNHDVWSELSAALFRKYSGHDLHYSLDYQTAHFTILDDSRSDDLSAAELDFLERDLKAHASAPLKMIVSHRPSWIVPAALGNTDFPLHRLARQYGVRYVIAGHVHQLIHIDLQGITYLSMPSSGGHLRLTKAYEDGWFFGHALVDVNGSTADFRIEESRTGRVTPLSAWGMNGLLHH